MKKVSNLNDFNCLVQARNGLFVANRHDFYLGNALIRYGEFSEAEWSFLAQFLQPGATVVEVGANIGTHTVSIARAVGTHGRVIAVEPQRVIFQYLCANLALNGLMNVETHQCGCGSDAGTLVVPEMDYSCAVQQNFGGVSLQKSGRGEAVPICRLDDLVGNRKVDFIKIDVEGMEADVLHGAKNTILTSRPTLYIENDRLEKSEGLIRLLLGLDYRLYWHIPPLFNPDNFFGEKENIYGNVASFNMLCFPGESVTNVEGLQEIDDSTYHPLQPSGLSLEKIALRYHNAGRFADAEATYRQALAAKPDSAEIHKDLGNTLMSLGRLEEAEQSYRQALALMADYGSAYNNLGNVLRLGGRLEDAEQTFRRALELLPDSAEVHNNFGNVLADAGRIEEAEHLYRKAIVLKPDYAAAYVNRGNALLAINRPEVAEKSYRKAIGLKPDYVEAYIGLGQALRVLRRLAESEEAYRQALGIRPEHPEALNNLGNVLAKQDRFMEAENAYRQAIAIKPDYAEAYNGLGNARAGQECLDEAEQAYRWAISIKPACVEAYIGLGILLTNMLRFADAEDAYCRALDQKPDFAEAKWNLSFLALTLGRLEEGFRLYEARFSDMKDFDSLESTKNMFKQLTEVKRWTEEPLEGRSMLIVMEQGAGDSLMMMRYLPLLKQRGVTRLVVHCYPVLQRVFQSIGAVDGAIPTTEPLPVDPFDYYCPMMSLPHLFGTRLESIPGNVPYLSAPYNMKRKWRTRLKKAAGLKVGLVWAGNNRNVKDKDRSIPLHTFSPLTDIAGVQLVSLQKEEAAEQLRETGWDIQDWMKMCDDYMDTAALVAELDLVISVDTSVAHLAGALGKPVWLLNRYESEWRWMLDREDSPWYPTMKIFRQRERGNWASVISRVAEELARVTRSGLPPSVS